MERRTLRTLLLAIAVFAGLAAGVSKMTLSTGNETLVRNDHEAYRSNKEMEESFGGDSILVLFSEEEAGSMFSLENIRKMWNIEQRFRYEGDVFTFMSPAGIVHQLAVRQSAEIKKQVLKLSEGLNEMSGKMSGLVFGAFSTMADKLSDVSKGLQTFHGKSGMMEAGIPETQEELDGILYGDDGRLRPLFSNVVTDAGHSLMVVKLAGNLEDTAKEQIVIRLKDALSVEGFSGISYVISGKPVLDLALRSEMKRNMVKMAGMAMSLMLIILGLVFRVRWRMLSLGIVLISVIATVGFMGILSVPVTMVSMAVFPILIGLGIDYSIQFHNRFEEEGSVRRTMEQSGKAVAIAVFSTVLGFISLYTSPVPMIQDFGKMLTIGVLVSFAGSIVLLLPILLLRNKNDHKQEGASAIFRAVQDRETALDRRLGLLTRKVLRYATPILLVALALSTLGFMADGRVGIQTDIETFMPQNMDALNDIQFIRNAVGSTDQVVLHLKAPDILAEDNIRWIQQKVSQLEEKYPNVLVEAKSVDSLVRLAALAPEAEVGEYTERVAALPGALARMFINEDHSQSVILLNIRHLPTEELRVFLSHLREDITNTAMTVRITGKSVLDVEMVDGLTSGRIRMTIIGLILVFVALILIYRNPVRALIPILPVAMIIGISGGMMHLLNIQYTPITATLGALVLGMGTEMTIMLMERYLEERASGKEKTDAMMVSVVKIGKAIVASGLTTIGGFSVLIASAFVILRDFGLMTVINISLALLSTFVVLPAVMVLLDRFLVGKGAVERTRLTGSQARTKQAS